MSCILIIINHFWQHTHSGDVSMREFTEIYKVPTWRLSHASSSTRCGSTTDTSDAMFSAPFLLLSLRWVPPTVALLGSPVTYMAAWTALRCASLVMSARAASRLETRLYSWYQAMVGFWFETWSGVEVGAGPGGGAYSSQHSVCMYLRATVIYGYKF